jgi:peptidyl-prolyl cis-trans isomerase SurA
MKDDYQTLYDAALQTERATAFSKWVKEKIAITYIKISDEFKGCDFLQSGWLK